MTVPVPCAQALDTCHDLRGRDFLSIRDLRRAELRALLDVAADLKASPAAYAHVLSGATLAMVFEKPSLRTRVSFDVAAYQLGGHAIYLSPQEIGLGTREPIGDVARTLEGLVQAVMVRTFAHQTVERLAEAAAVPVINGLSDKTHPCQALADFLTIREVFGRLDDLTVAYVGDSNNVTESLIEASAMLGVRMRVASPSGYRPSNEVLAWSAAQCADASTACHVTSSPEEAVRGAHVIYTDTWISMGQESDAERRRRAFSGYEVTPGLFELAAPGAVFMHCLPAHRGEEVAPEVIDSQRSVVFRQAANRLPTEKALLVALLSREV
jgi:ornithine carbamoyltransferase